MRAKIKILSSISKKKAAKVAFRIFCTPQTKRIKKIPPVFETADKLGFTVEGRYVRGYRWKTGAGKKVMIIHGFESASANFFKYVFPLSQKGFDVYAFDAPGHGKSDGTTLNVDLYKKMILKADSKYGPMHSFMAHSLGGLALTMALEEIKDGTNRKVALLAPATETSTATKSFFNLLKLDKSVQQEFENIIVYLAGNPSAWFSISRAIADIPATFLWIHDDKDRRTPYDDAIRVRDKNYSHVTFVTTHGLGHRRIYRDEKVMKMVIEFVTS